MHPMKGLLLLAFSVLGSSQSPPKPDGIRRVPSTMLKSVDISYKEVPAGICGNASSYAGYVNFPPNTMMDVKHDYPIHSFFWYFKAQKDPQTAPLIVWVNGGPGGSAMFGLFTEHGPCQVNSSLGTNPNLWSWNKDYNMLYVDQPVQTGFSYDIPTPGFFDAKTGAVTPLAPGEVAPKNHTAFPGVFSSQDIMSTANTTENAARHYWNFLQVWTQDFPMHRTTDTSLNIWTESYGGRYGPSFSAYIQSQNARIKKGCLPGAQILNLKTLGIINGCVDIIAQESAFPEYVYDRNPYGLPGLTHSEYFNALEAYSKKNGCEDKILECLHLGQTSDPGMYGNVTEVNEVCEDASDYCQDEVENHFMLGKKYGYYDIRHCYLDPFPSNSYQVYLAQEKVLKALGVPVNYVDASAVVAAAFNRTGDYTRRNPQGFLENIASLLDSGVQVTLVFGDADVSCNWVGGERVSLAVNHAQSMQFSRAGYADVEIDGRDVAGQVRQHGLFSFIRVYQAGHMVASAQPNAAYSILQRAMAKMDIATGKVPATCDYSTNGSFRSTTSLEVPPGPVPTCHVRAMGSTCAGNQIEAIVAGKARIENGVVVEPLPPPGTCPDLPPSRSG